LEDKFCYKIEALEPDAKNEKKLRGLHWLYNYCIHSAVFRFGLQH